jgi:hypothetical protein
MLGGERSNSKILLRSAEIHFASRELVVRGEVKRLPSRAFDVLVTLANAPAARCPKKTCSGRLGPVLDSDGFSTNLFTVPGGDGPTARVLSGIRHRGVSATEFGVYYVPAERPNEVRFLDTRSGTDHVVLRTPDRVIHYLATDGAERQIAVVVEEHPPGDLMLIRGLPGL